MAPWQMAVAAKARALVASKLDAVMPVEAIRGNVAFSPVLVAWFAAFSLRIVVLHSAWTTYVPVISPVFGSGAHWAASQRRSLAIVAHVLSGIVVLSSGLAQLDKTLRTSRPALHRWLGRLYVVSGIVMLASLRPLRAASGGYARQGDGPSLAMNLFIDAASLAWAAATATAVFCAAVRRDYRAHRKWAATSLALALAPLAQRWSLLVLAPLAMTGRMLLDASVHGLPFWRSAWGLAPEAWSGAPTGERVLSFSGYGVAENSVFALSAWLGLLEVAYGAYAVVWSCRVARVEGSTSAAGAKSSVTLAEDVIADFSVWECARVGLGAEAFKRAPECAYKLAQRINLVAVRLWSAMTNEASCCCVARGLLCVGLAVATLASALVAVVFTAVLTALMAGMFLVVELGLGIVLSSAAYLARAAYSGDWDFLLLRAQ